jgi:hypothetical protein
MSEPSKNATPRLRMHQKKSSCLICAVEAAADHRIVKMSPYVYTTPGVRGMMRSGKTISICEKCLVTAEALPDSPTAHKVSRALLDSVYVVYKRVLDGMAS